MPTCSSPAGPDRPRGCGSAATRSRRSGLGERLAGRRDAHVIAGHAVLPRQLGVAHRWSTPRCCAFQKSAKRQRPARALPAQAAARAGDQRRDAHREGEGVEPRVLLPAVLLRRPGRWRAMKPSARRTMSSTSMPRSASRSSSAAASSTGKAVSSSCTPCQYGVPPSHWFWFQWPSCVLRGDQVAQRVARLARRRRAPAARRRIRTRSRGQTR